MFYSQTFLARKGPLSTVWIAAHLQHRLKKSQYTSTDIPSTVQHIMDPGVPIALRMSAHLLLGVVRIYSKKVDYLLTDCNAVRTVLYKVFASVSNNTLPEDARQAPIHSITMPATFDLDALNLGDEIDYNRYEDVHTRSQEEITLEDRTPIVMDNYVTICFDEDMAVNSSNTQLPPDNEARPMEEDIIPQSPSTDVVGVQDGGPSFHRESHTPDHTFDHLHAFSDFGDTNHPLATHAMPVEGLRDASIDNDTIGNPPDLGFNDTEPNIGLNQTMNEKDQILETIDEIRPEPTPTQQAGPSTPVASQDGASDAQVCGGQAFQSTLMHSSANFGVIPSPLLEQEQQQEREREQPQGRGRKRKQFFDNPIVLTNRFMRESLNNTRNILRQRRDVPSSAFGTWKLNNSRLKEQIFYQPIFPGLCQDLLNIHNREYICSKPHLVISEEERMEDHIDVDICGAPPINQIAEEATATATDNNVPTSSVDIDIEIEHLRSVADAPHPTIPDQSIDIEPIIEGISKSPVKGYVATPSSVPEMVPIPHIATSAGVHIREMETPSTYRDDNDTYRDVDDILQNYGLTDTYQLINSPEKEELWFLEEENNTPSSSQRGSQSTSKSISTLSGRTRGVAQFLKDYSPCTPISEVPAEDFSLNKILEGKTRKIAARMFFEVLVLKTRGFIDVQQENPYDDISLKVTKALSNGKQ